MEIQICDNCGRSMFYDPYFKKIVCRQCGNVVNANIEPDILKWAINIMGKNVYCPQYINKCIIEGYFLGIFKTITGEYWATVTGAGESCEIPYYDWERCIKTTKEEALIALNKNGD